MLLVGECINGAIPVVGKVILLRDSAFIASLAQEQKARGAHMLDMNAAVSEGNEVEDLPWLAKTVQKTVDCS